MKTLLIELCGCSIHIISSIRDKSDDLRMARFLAMHAAEMPKSSENCLHEGLTLCILQRYHIIPISYNQMSTLRE